MGAQHLATALRENKVSSIEICSHLIATHSLSHTDTYITRPHRQSNRGCGRRRAQETDQEALAPEGRSMMDGRQCTVRDNQRIMATNTGNRLNSIFDFVCGISVDIYSSSAEMNHCTVSMRNSVRFGSGSDARAAVRGLDVEQCLGSIRASRIRDRISEGFSVHDACTSRLPRFQDVFEVFDGFSCLKLMVCAMGNL